MKVSIRTVGTVQLQCHAFVAARPEAMPHPMAAEILLPPNGDESLRPNAERTRQLTGAHNQFVAVTPKRKILIDASIDSLWLAAGLAQLGFGADDITDVLITHGDSDHIQGLVTEEGSLRFPNARYLLHSKLWSDWVQDADEGFYSEEQRQAARVLVSQARDRTQWIVAETEILAGIRAVPSPGHRDSHLAFLLRDGNFGLLHVGDAFLHQILLEDLSRGVVFDTDPEEAIASRRMLLERAVAERAILFSSHFPDAGLWRTESTANGFSYRAA